MKGFKGFDSDMKCRGFQYAENSTFEEDVVPDVCSKGLHFCQLPLDVFNYYPPVNGNQFCEVESLGEFVNSEDKTSTNKLSVKGKLSISNLFKAHFEIVMDKVTISSNTANTSGDGAHANTSGDGAHANTSGDEAHANTSGFRAHANTSGFRAHANTSGYKAHANTSGSSAHANTSGDGAHANTSGDEAHANTSGDEAHANTSGSSAHANTSGFRAHANTSGSGAHANTSGSGAHANTSGDGAHANTSGSSAHANTSGSSAHANTSGSSAHANTSGYKAHANTSGDDAIACALGIKSKSRAEKGWIIIVDWRYDNKWFINNIHSAKVNTMLLDTLIEPDKYYWFDQGVLKSCLIKDA